MTKPYQHPHRSPEHVMNVYRRHLVGQKRKWMAEGKGNRCLRGIIHYRDIVDEYVSAKALVISILKERGQFPRIRQKNERGEETLTVFL